jgi:uncharacterized membrane protein
MDRRSKIVLVASVAANLFLAGALIGALVVGSRLVHERTEARRGGDRPGVWSAVQAVPPERRRALRQVMREQALQAAPDLRAARDARRTAAQLIAVPVYDAAAVEAALKRARDYDSRARAKIDAALAARLAQFSPEERAAFARVMIRGPRGGGPGRGGPGGGRGDGRGDGRGRDGRGPPGDPPPPPPQAERP